MLVADFACFFGQPPEVFGLCPGDLRRVAMFLRESVPGSAL
jgi:hypothetical protein